MEGFKQLLFLVNILLVLIDVTLGYHLAPIIARMGGMGGAGVRTIRRLLTGIVAFYMFLNCFAYFRSNHALLVIVTILILADFIGQLYMRRKWRKGHAPPE